MHGHCVTLQCQQAHGELEFFSEGADVTLTGRLYSDLAAEIRSLLNAAGLVVSPTAGLMDEKAADEVAPDEQADDIEVLAELQSETSSTRYYKIEDDTSFYEDAGDLDSSPDFLQDVDLYEGESIKALLPETLNFTMDSDFGNDPLLVWGYPLQCMRDDLLEILLEAGADEDNLEVFDAVIHNPMSSKKILNYRAVYVLERISLDEVPADCPVICEDYSTDLLVSEKVKNSLAKKFPSLVFNEA